ncbi:DUF4156 domain-containing protein [Ferrimonas balearica]|uniref:DUF4156 domain-containing protein n=1 Tax=Ferrimonas balearica TaxID=44012 RepID=UPI001C997390|nr:DUF4156 domain-containing protein [Ferrimonas balearica]MBY5990589.1 DUF4156 domain-containing protein [Ferrimonas balearica]
MRIWPALLAALTLTGCATFTEVTPRDSEAEAITMVFDNATPLTQCRRLDTWVGSEGHWYTYLFISNFDLTTGALNQLRNHAAEIGGNLVEIKEMMDFATSVTYVGHIYHCPDDTGHDGPDA